MGHIIESLCFGEDETQLVFREEVNRWGREVLSSGARSRDEEGVFDEDLFWEMCHQLGLLGISTSEAFGGLGERFVTQLIAFEALGRYDAGYSMSYLTHQLLFCDLLALGARHSYHRDVLESALKGEFLGGMGLTESSGGSDVFGMRTRVERKGGDYVLNGEKSWITNAPVGGKFLVFARSGEARKSLSLFIVDSEMEGFSRGGNEEKMGMRSSPTGSLYFKDCVLPSECLVGEEDCAFELLLRHLSYERLGLAAISCGIAMESLVLMDSYASERYAFGKALRSFGQIQRYLARSGAKLSAARSFLYQVASCEEERGFGYFSDGVKYVCSEVGEEVSRLGIQVLGANGYSRDYSLERMHRDSILLSIGGGTSEMLEKNMSKF